MSETYVHGDGRKCTQYIGSPAWFYAGGRFGVEFETCERLHGHPDPVTNPTPERDALDILVRDIVPIPPHMATLTTYLKQIRDLMYDRGNKYGAGNIAEFGQYGVLVRMSDKFARLKQGLDNYDDETLESTLEDVVGYALIWLMILNDDWPGVKPVKAV